MSNPRPRCFSRFLSNIPCAYVIAVGGWPLTGETTSWIDARWRTVSCFIAVLICITVNDSLYIRWLHAVELVIKGMSALKSLAWRAPCPVELDAQMANIKNQPGSIPHRKNSSVASKSSNGSKASQLDAEQWPHIFCHVGLGCAATTSSTWDSESQSSLSLDSKDESFVPNKTGNNGRGDYPWNQELGDSRGYV